MIAPLPVFRGCAIRGVAHEWRSHEWRSQPCAGAVPLFAAPPETDVELRRIDDACNARRVYGITIAPTLWCAHALRIAWGRLGSPLRVRTEEFATAEALMRRRRFLIALRLRHGYVIA